MARRFLPLTDSYEGGRLLTRTGGRTALTPLFMALLAIGTTNAIFALDSIPAIFGVTRHAYIVFAANAFALLGLRPLFFLVSGLLDRILYMSAGLSAILAFIGVKLVLEFSHDHDHVPQIGTIASLLVVIAILVITVLASALAIRRDPERRAHAGTLHSTHDEQPADRRTSEGA